MDENKQLYELAVKAKQFAYAPYSNFKVGAALLTEDGMVFIGNNIENKSFGATNCAERTAIFKAVSEGKTNLKKIAIASDSEDFTYPCGICLQVMAEFMYDGEVILGNGTEIKVFKVKDLMPQSFNTEF